MHLSWFIPPERRPLLLRLSLRRITPEKRAHIIRHHLIELGAPYIKIGQFLALRPDILGQPLTQVLSQLHDHVPPFPQKEAEEVFQTTFGHPPSAIFAYFGEAVSAASIAQVHVAHLKGGQKVAVKIVRPHLKSACKKAFKTLRFLTHSLSFFFSGLKTMRLLGVLKTLEESLDLEMDMRMEGAAIAAIAKNGQSDAVVLGTPEIIWPLTNGRILTTSWVEGTPLKNVYNNAIRKQIAHQLIQAFLIQALYHGFFHADLHPGNLFVTPSNQLVAVDFGLMGHLNEPLRLFLGQVIMGFLRRDYTHIATLYVQQGYIPSHRQDEFTQALYFIGEPIVGKSSHDISIAHLLESLFQLMTKFNIPLHAELVLLHKTVMTVESVAFSLDENHNFWETARPIITKWMHQTLNVRSRIKHATVYIRRWLERANKPNPPLDLTVVMREITHTLWLMFALFLAICVISLLFIRLFW